jgi:hypothetical protein
MNDDVAFEQLLDDLASTCVPHLIPFVKDAKLGLVFAEQRDKKLPDWAELFYSGDQILLHKLLGFKRSVILRSIYVGLPLWYSSKIIVSIIGFIKHGTKKKIIFKKKPKTPKASADNNNKNFVKIDWMVKNLLARSGSIESELDSLAESWNQLLDKNSRQKLRRDVDSIVNAKISYEMKTFNFGNLSISVIEDIAESLISSNNTLNRIPNKKALRKYIMLIILKRLKNKRGASTRVS